jgi:hypothetical protein
VRVKRAVISVVCVWRGEVGGEKEGESVLANGRVLKRKASKHARTHARTHAYTRQES